MKPILGVITMKDLYFIVIFVLLSLRPFKTSILLIKNTTIIIIIIIINNNNKMLLDRIFFHYITVMRNIFLVTP